MYSFLIEHKFYLKTILVAVLVFPSSVFSGEVIESQVTYKNGYYSAKLEIQIMAPSKIVYALFTDFDYLSRLSENITSSTLINDNAPDYLVQIETHNCVLFFCKDLKQTQRVNELDKGYISVEDIKGESDFIYASTMWHIRAFNEGTRVTFQSKMKPDFWLPPMLGPWLFKKRMIKDTQAMIDRLEELANDDN